MAQRREEILDAAVRLFAEKGYRRTDVQVVADTVGVGKGTVYRHFGTKQQLFLAAVDRGMRRLQEAVDRAIAGITDPIVRFPRVVATYLEFFEARPELCELFIQERAEFRDRRKATFIEHREANAERWRTLFRGAVADGQFRDLPVERVTELISDLLYGTMFTNFMAGRRKPVEVQAGDIADVVFDGILSDRERARWRDRAGRPREERTDGDGLRAAGRGQGSEAPGEAQAPAAAAKPA